LQFNVDSHCSACVQTAEGISLIYAEANMQYMSLAIGVHKQIPK